MKKILAAALLLFMAGAAVGAWQPAGAPMANRGYYGV